MVKILVKNASDISRFDYFCILKQRGKAIFSLKTSQQRKQVKAHFQLSMFSNPLLRTSTNHVVTEAVVVCKHGESPLGPIGGDAEMNL